MLNFKVIIMNATCRFTLINHFFCTLCMQNLGEKIIPAPETGKHCVHQLIYYVTLIYSFDAERSGCEARLMIAT